jgi:hypothetical protein
MGSNSMHPIHLLEMKNQAIMEISLLEVAETVAAVVVTGNAATLRQEILILVVMGTKIQIRNSAIQLPIQTAIQNQQSQGPPNVTCPDGSTPDATGKCPEVTTGIDCSKTPNDPSCTPTPTPPTTCPDGSQPDVDGKCPTPVNDNSTAEGVNGGGGIPRLLADNQTAPGNGNDTGIGLT